MELRFSNNEAIYQAIYQVIRDTLSGKNMIVPVSLSEKEDKKEQKKEILQQQKVSVPEPFEVKRREQDEVKRREQDEVKPSIEQKMKVLYDVIKENKEEYRATSGVLNKQEKHESTTVENHIKPEIKSEVKIEIKPEVKPEIICKSESKPEQITLPADLLAKDNRKEFTLIGQVFATYWLIEMEEQLYIIDQHAAHEKVLFERTMDKLRKQEEIYTQSLLPPMILSLTMREAECLNKNLNVFKRLGFEIEEFGGLEFKVTEVPADLVAVDSKELLTEVLNSLLSERDYKNTDVILEKVASLSCKAAVKGNHRMSEAEAKQLISDMLTLDNPYHCPHGRPTTISMSKYELERKFKRIV